MVKNGKLIYLTNEYSASGAYDHEYHVGNELFVSIDTNTDGNSHLTGTINDVKRDKYVLMVAWVFILTLLFVGKKQGLLSVISLVVNAWLLSKALDIYLKTSGFSLLWICSISVILFTVISLLLVNGFNEKTYAAIVATLLGTLFSLVITYFVMVVTSERGLRYEEMQFVTSPYRMVFMAGLFVGALGAVMDVAMTMSSSLFGLYEENQGISIKALKTSGMEIGKDIMGTIGLGLPRQAERLRRHRQRRPDRSPAASPRRVPPRTRSRHARPSSRTTTNPGNSAGPGTTRRTAPARRAQSRCSTGPAARRSASRRPRRRKRPARPSARQLRTRDSRRPPPNRINRYGNR